jgi:hypothetical protein
VSTQESTQSLQVLAHAFIIDSPFTKLFSLQKFLNLYNLHRGSLKSVHVGFKLSDRERFTKQVEFLVANLFDELVELFNNIVDVVLELKVDSVVVEFLLVEELLELDDNEFVVICVVLVILEVLVVDRVAAEAGARVVTEDGVEVKQNEQLNPEHPDEHRHT